MKIQVAKQDLVDALNVVVNSYNPSGSDITAHFVFRSDDAGNVTVYTFAGRLFSEAPVKCVVENIDEAKAFTVEGARLMAWTKAAKDAALELELDPETKVVSATSPRGVMEFQSLDPASFPFWDPMWADVSEKGTIRADRLLAALTYSRSFSYEKETKKPQLCLIECQGGMLWSTDEKAIALVEVAGLKDSSLRIHRNDAGGILKFLGTCGDQDITLLEHDRSLLFKRLDGAVFGESRFTAQYPDLSVNRDSAPTVWWDLPLAQIVEGIPYLRSGVGKEDPRLFFSREGDGPVKMGVVAQTGNLMTIDVPVTDSGATEDGKLSDEGFILNYGDLLKTLAPWEGETVTFGINTKGSKKGYVRFREHRDEIDYLTVLSWIRR